MKPRVLVLNCFVKGWNILKALADNGFIVYGGDYRRKAPGLFSNRIVDKSKNLIYPNPKIDESGFVQSVLDYLSRERIDIVLPVNAAEMMALARHKEAITGRALFPFENYYKLLLFHDKKYFHEIMSGCCDSMLLPRSWSVGNQTPPITDILQRAGLGGESSVAVPFQPMEDYSSVDHFINAHPGLVYPLIVKTRRATSAVGVYRVHSEAELRKACDALGDADIIIQEYLVGRGVGLSLIRWDSPPVGACFGHKRVREFPISGGASTSREPWACEESPLARIISELLNRLDWHGVIMFELKEMKTELGQAEYKFLEANPRFWGSVPLAIANGVNFPVLLCRAAMDLDPGPIEKRHDVRARILFSDSLSLLLNVVKRRNMSANLKDFFNFRNLYLDDIDLHDLPATLRIIGRMASELISRIF